MPLVHAWANRAAKRCTQGTAELQTFERPTRALYTRVTEGCYRTPPRTMSILTFPTQSDRLLSARRPARRCRVTRCTACRESLWSRAERRPLSGPLVPQLFSVFLSSDPQSRRRGTDLPDLHLLLGQSRKSALGD